MKYLLALASMAFISSALSQEALSFKGLPLGASEADMLRLYPNANRSGAVAGCFATASALSWLSMRIVLQKRKTQRPAPRPFLLRSYRLPESPSIG